MASPAGSILVPAVQGVSASTASQYGFQDGSIGTLGFLQQYVQALAADDPALGDQLLNAFWNMTGDVQVLQQNGNTLLDLVASGATASSVFQNIVLPDRALSVNLTSVRCRWPLEIPYKCWPTGQAINSVDLSQLTGSTHIWRCPR